MENYRIIRKLGSGNFAKVYLALHEPSSRQVALKLIDKAKVQGCKMLERVHREIRNMKKISHPNIVNLFESFETDSHHVIAMEYVSGGELFDYVLDQQGLSESEAKDIFQQIVEAVDHCHKNSVVHRDLKLENILLDRDGLPKLADFGFSKETHSKEMFATYCGSSLYASPEMVVGKPYIGTECDVWSLGVVLYTLLTAQMPFDDRDYPHFVQAVKSGNYQEPARTSHLARDLISRMLDSNSKRRATIAEILSHPWLQSRKSPVVSSGASTKTRKSDVCYSSSKALDIRNALIEIDCNCDCSCHSVTLKGHRDSVITQHCSDCEYIFANDPSTMHHERHVSRNSSGYGSESGSMLFTPRISLVGSSPTSDADRKVSYHRTSFSKSPVPTVPQILEIEDDEEIVFV